MKIRRRALIAVLTFASFRPASGQHTTGPRVITLEPSAVLTIPDAAPDGSWALTGFQGVRVLQNGGFAVSTLTEIHRFDSLGHHVMAVGRKGEGPGEFNQISGFADCVGGTYVVSDWMQRRLTVLGSPPAKSRVTPFPQSGVTNALVPILCEGQKITFVDHTTDPNRATSWPRRTLHQDTLLVVRGRETMRSLDTVARVPSLFSYEGLQQPFGPAGHVAMNERWLAYGITSDSSLRVTARAGGVAQRITIRGLPVVLVSAGMRARRTAQSETATPPSIWIARLKDLFASVPWPAHLPLWDSLLLDDSSRLWVREYRSPLAADSTPNHWHAVGLTGMELGVLTLAATDELLAVRGPQAIVIHRSDDDSESLQVRKIHGL